MSSTNNQRDRERMRARYHRNKARGTCPQCSEPPAPGSVRCAKHRDEAATRYRATRAASEAHKREERKANQQCIWCREPAVAGKVSCQPCLDAAKGRSAARARAAGIQPRTLTGVYKTSTEAFPVGLTETQKWRWYLVWRSQQPWWPLPANKPSCQEMHRVVYGPEEAGGGKAKYRSFVLDALGLKNPWVSNS